MGASGGSANFEFDVCVVGGCGHVGLPLAIVMAHRELRVAIVDIDTSAVESVRSGRMPFMEEKAEPMLAEVINKNLIVDDDPTLISRSRIVVVVIGTPVDEHLNPKFHKIHRFFIDLMPYLVDGQCLILRSTIYPGTTEKVDKLLRAAGRDVHVAFCPERIAQGHAMRELVGLPQIVAGCDDEATRVATDLFRRIAPSIVPMQPVEAELTKIFANVWRYIQFATANQFFMIATDFGLDFYRIYDALTRDYPRMAGLPKSGFAAGPCLFKDTMQLAAATESRFSLGHAAMLINEGLPDYRRAPHEIAIPASAVDGWHSRHGVQGRHRRLARIAVLQTPQDPRVRGGRRRMHRSLRERPAVRHTRRGARAVRSARTWGTAQ